MYTYRWLQRELRHLPPRYKVTVTAVGDPSELSIPVPCITTPCTSQQDDISTAMQQHPADIYILLQLTLPVREQGLLARTIMQYTLNRMPIVSATEVHDNAWRVIDKDGVWQPKTDKRVLMHDGVIYACGDNLLDAIYDRTAKHDVIVSSTRLPIVDVDYPDDIPLNIDLLYK